MTTTPKPFARGCYSPRVERQVVLTSDVADRLMHIPLHVSQRDLADDQVRSRDCAFNGSFAIILGDELTPLGKELLRDCPDRGRVHDVIHAILDQEDGMDIPVAYCLSHLQVAGAMRRLTFRTGHYSRAWEISTNHISMLAYEYLAGLADIGAPTRFLFDAFRLPYCPALGVKLISTPWTDGNLQHVEGVTAAQLREDHLQGGMPEHLADILHLAGKADVRFLVFDPDAPVLMVSPSMTIRTKFRPMTVVPETTPCAPQSIETHQVEMEFRLALNICIDAMCQNDALGETLVFVREGARLHMRQVDSHSIEAADLNRCEMVLFDGGNTSGDLWKHVFFPQRRQHFYACEVD